MSTTEWLNFLKLIECYDEKPSEKISDVALSFFMTYGTCEDSEPNELGYFLEEGIDFYNSY